MDNKRILLDDVLKILDPGKEPCDCIVDIGGYYVQECSCHNSGDLANVAAWCARANLCGNLRKAFYNDAP